MRLSLSLSLNSERRDIAARELSYWLGKTTANYVAILIDETSGWLWWLKLVKADVTLKPYCSRRGNNC